MTQSEKTLDISTLESWLREGDAELNSVLKALGFEGQKGGS